MDFIGFISLLLVIFLIINLITRIIYKSNGTDNENFQCIKTGCVGQICSDKPVITPCNWKCEYECYKDASCVNIDNKCQFIKTPKFNDCINLCK